MNVYKCIFTLHCISGSNVHIQWLGVECNRHSHDRPLLHDCNILLASLLVVYVHMEVTYETIDEYIHCMCTVIACAVHVFHWSDGTYHVSLAKRKIIVCDSCCCYSLNCLIVCVPDALPPIVTILHAGRSALHDAAHVFLFVSPF